MPIYTFTNLLSTPVQVAGGIANLGPVGSTTVSKSVELPANFNEKIFEPDLLALRYTFTSALTANEKTLGTSSPSNTLMAPDIAAVPAAAVIGISQTITITVPAAAAGTADDVTIFALNALPYKIVVLDGVFRVTTAIGGSVVKVRTATADAGTNAIEFSSAATGYQTPNATVLGAVTLTPASNVGLFLRRTDRGVAGTLILHVMRVE